MLRFQGINLMRRHSGGEQAAGGAGQSSMDVEQVEDFGKPDVPDEHATVRHDGDQPGLLQPAHRLPQRAAADLQLLRQRVLVQLGAGDEIAGGQHGAEAAINGRDERRRLAARYGRQLRLVHSRDVRPFSKRSLHR